MIMPGRQVLEDVAREYGITAEQIIGSPLKRYPFTNARVEAARRMSAMGMRGSKIARIIKRTDNTVSWYLGRSSGLPPVHIPGVVATGTRQSRLLATMTSEWKTPREIAAEAGYDWVPSITSSLVSRVMDELLRKGLVQKGGEAHRPQWRLK